MTEKYDAIVVGAGLGGMAAAAVLAQNGLSVLLLERHNIPGGYATSFVRGRYEFEVALHELSGIGPPENRGMLYKFLHSLGVAEQLEFIQIPELYRSVFSYLDVVLPVGLKAFEAKLCETFPDEAKGIQRFLKRVDKLHNELYAYEENGGPGNPLTAPFRMASTLRYLPTTWGSVLNRDVKDPRARAVLSQYWGYFGLGPSEASFMYFANALGIYTRLGASYPKGRSQALSNALVEAIERFGGDVRLNCGVKEITASDGRVTGVVTEDGDAIDATWVVSNTDPITTARNLIGEENLPAKFLKKLRFRALSAGSVNVFLGVARSPEELGLRYHENFINADYDFDAHHEAMRVIGPPKAVLLACYNALDPDISPPGTSLISLTTLTYGQPWLDLPQDQYVATKNKVADAMITMAEQIAPDIRKYAEVVEVATPITNIRYTGNISGSIYGFTNTAYGHTILRMPQRGPLKGLYFAGAFTQPGGGFQPCMMSGQTAAEQILKRARKA